MAASTIILAGRYRLDGRIAVGGVGEVWRAADTALARPVAVKLLRAEFAGHEETRARFRAEARHAGALSHPGIARVYDYGEDDPPYPPYLVLELVDGPSLAEVLAGGPLDAARSMRVVAEAAAGLAAAHAAGLVHRDIKPGNLLISSSGQVKITDFGIAHAAGSAPITQTGTVLGTPAYLAPERIAGASGAPAADLYALGVVAYECLAGSPPFAGDQFAVAAAHRDRALPPLPAGVPEPVAALVTELTEKAPDARPASAAEVARRAGWLAEVLAQGRDVALAGLARPVAGSGHRSALPATVAGAAVAGGPVADGAVAGAAVAGGAVAGGAVADGAVAGAAVAGGAVADGAVAGAAVAGGAVAGGAVAGGAVAGELVAGGAGAQMPDRPAHRPRRVWPARAVVLAMAAAILAAGTAGWLLAAAFAAQPPAHPAVARARGHPAGPGARTGEPRGRHARPGTPAHTVTVDGAALVGCPVTAVRDRLRGLGFQVRVHWRQRGRHPPGTVLELRPSGALPSDSVVVLTGTAQPVPPGQDQGGQAPHRGDGNGHPDGRPNRS